MKIISFNLTVRVCFFSFGCLFPMLLNAVIGYVPLEDNQEEPWLTGPLITGSGSIASKGHLGTKPSFNAWHQSSSYGNEWKIEKQATLNGIFFLLPFWVGLTDKVDVSFRSGCQWSDRSGATGWALNDCSAQFGFQLHEDPLPHKSWLPAMKLFVREYFPIGKYKNLNPEKMGTDAGGFGSWATTIGLNFQKILYFGHNHFLNNLFNIECLIPTSVHVKGFNTYGGGFGCDGTG